MDDRLFKKFKFATKKLLEELITEYIFSLVNYNEIRCSFHEPLAVRFGEALPWKFICCSGEIHEKYKLRERLDKYDFKAALQPFLLLAESQGRILQSIARAVAAADAGLMIRDKFLNSKNAKRKREIRAELGKHIGDVNVL